MVTSRPTAIAATDDGHAPAGADKLVGGDRLLGDVRDLIRRTHGSLRTQQAQFQRAERLTPHHRKRHPDARRDGFVPSLGPSLWAVARDFIYDERLGC